MLLESDFIYDFLDLLGNGVIVLDIQGSCVECGKWFLPACDFVHIWRTISWRWGGKPWGFSGTTVGKESTCQYSRLKRCRFVPLVEKIPWRRNWQPTPVFLSGESHGQRSLAVYSPRGHKESYATEHAHVDNSQEPKCFCFPIQRLSSLAIQETLSVCLHLYSSSASAIFLCLFCSPTKPVSLAWWIRFCPVSEGLAVWVCSCVLSEPQMCMQLYPIGVSPLSIILNTKGNVLKYK